MKLDDLLDALALVGIRIIFAKLKERIDEEGAHWLFTALQGEKV